MNRDETYKENSLLVVDGIPVAKDSHLKFHLRLGKHVCPNRCHISLFGY